MLISLFSTNSAQPSTGGDKRIKRIRTFRRLQSIVFHVRGALIYVHFNGNPRAQRVINRMPSDHRAINFVQRRVQKYVADVFMEYLPTRLYIVKGIKITHRRNKSQLVSLFFFYFYLFGTLGFLFIDIIVVTSHWKRTYNKARLSFPETVGRYENKFA